jgi:hypothetical protein
MLRPLPPFRVRPLTKPVVRKAPGSVFVCELTDEEPVISIKGVRRPLKLARPLAASRLKVLGRGAPGHA